MKIYQKELEDLIEPFLLEKLKQSEFECYETPAIDLLKHNRFDLAFKLAYLELHNRAPRFAKDLYKDHIRAFSLGSYSEPGNEDKNTIETFFKSFEITFNNIKENGFDARKTLIPVSKSNTIINGAHRVASSIFLKRYVKCVQLDELNEPNYNYDFFYKRNVPPNYLDFAATKFIEYAENIYIAFIWPTAEGKDADIEEIIPNIVYRKDIKLNYQGAHNLISQIYFGEPWLGTIENDFRGAKGKLHECFKNFGYIRVIAFQAPNFDMVLEVKEKIRKLFNVGKHSVHITDTHEEAIRIAQVVFNDNGIHFLNNAKPNKYINTYDKIDKFKRTLMEKDIAFDDAVLDGGIVLSIYGLRECSDIDYISSLSFEHNDSELEHHDSELEHHDSELEHHDSDKDMLIYNPKYYFIFNSIKFFSYAQTYKMKKNRIKANGNKKDINDCKMMEAVLEDNLIKGFINKNKQNIYYLKIKVRYKLVLILKRLGLYRLVKNIYHGIREKS
ncbi:hypothetical protein [Vibrio metschnikovii]|uniref:hypothetical protein n=1 Tax=Vibrio metschnikovii TaxID=28172 RepID=UPI002FCB250E